MIDIKFRFFLKPNKKVYAYFGSLLGHKACCGNHWQSHGGGGRR